MHSKLLKSAAATKSFGKMVFQEYIHNPLLFNNPATNPYHVYNGLKFDMRVVVLLNQRRELYVFNEFVCRFSRYTYNLGDSTKPFPTRRHLTNAHLQSKCEEKGAKLPVNGTVMKYEDFCKIYTGSVQRLHKDINKIVYHSVGSAVISLRGDKLKNFRSGKGYQLFGYDMFIDSKHKLHLLEINVSPAAKVMPGGTFETILSLTCDLETGYEGSAQVPISFIGKF